MAEGQQEKPKAPRISGTALIGLFVVLAIAGFLIAFTVWRALPKPVPIADILNDLRTYDGTTVYVKGTASNPTNLAIVKYFTLTDASGEIIIVTEEGLPHEGKDLVVRGQVNQLFEIAGISKTVITEVSEPD